MRRLPCQTLGVDTDVFTTRDFERAALRPAGHLRTPTSHAPSAASCTHPAPGYLGTLKRKMQPGD